MAKPKKIMVVLGSPRRQGNTAQVAEWVADSARQAGAEVEVVDAPRLRYQGHGCTACMACQKSDQFCCVLDDEATPVLARMPEHDVLVFATPVYFMGFTAQIKVLMDRMFSLVKISLPEHRISHPFKHTSFALIATAGGDLGSGLALCETTLKAIAGFFGKPCKSLLIPFAPGAPGELAKNRDVEAKARAFGAELAR